MLTLSIDTNSDAFADNRDMEIARILRDIADRIEDGQYSSASSIRDINGNTCGRFWFVGEE